MVPNPGDVIRFIPDRARWWGTSQHQYLMDPPYWTVLSAGRSVHYGFTNMTLESPSGKVIRGHCFQDEAFMVDRFLAAALKAVQK